MVSKVSQKKNLSCIQVIKTLKVLLQGNYAMNELVQILNNDETGPIFNNSVISKYINTCRFCGIKIPKVNNKYYIASLPFGLKLNLSDLDLIKHMKTVVSANFSNKWIKSFDKITEKLNKYSVATITNVNTNEFNFSVELFEQAVAQKRKIKLLFKNRDELECIPIDIERINEKTFFNIYNKRIRQIDINRLSGIQMLSNTYIEPFEGSQSVVFKLKGALAKRYEARENETVQQCNDGTILVTNKNENEEYLISRLLRYDDKCEVLTPKMFREKMKNVISNMLSNYGES